MPIYEYRCAQCGAIREELRAISDRDDVLNCARCDAVVTRVTATRFGVRGTRVKTSDAALGASGGEFMANPDSFVKAMDTFGEKVGAPLTSVEKERAVSRLEDASK